MIISQKIIIVTYLNDGDDNNPLLSCRWWFESH